MDYLVCFTRSNAQMPLGNDFQNKHSVACRRIHQYLGETELLIIKLIVLKFASSEALLVLGNLSIKNFPYSYNQPLLHLILEVQHLLKALASNFSNSTLASSGTAAALHAPDYLCNVQGFYRH